MVEHVHGAAIRVEGREHNSTVTCIVQDIAQNDIHIIIVLEIIFTLMQSILKKEVSFYFMKGGVLG